MTDILHRVFKSEKVKVTCRMDTRTIEDVHFTDPNAIIVNLNDIEGLEEAEIEEIGHYCTINWEYDGTPPYLILPHFIKSVGPNTFRESKFERITWPDSCPTIPQGCFEGSSLVKLRNIDHVELVLDEAFVNCHGLKEFKWPDSSSVIPKGAFRGCTELERVTNIEHIEFIGEEAFALTALVSFDIPEMVEEIKNKTFYQCSSLSTVSGADHLVLIGCKAFFNSGLSELHVSDACCLIGHSAFAHSTYLSEFEWPGSCSTIPKYCFFGSGLRRITSIDKVNEIESGAFAQSRLKALDMSAAAIYHIGEAVFDKSIAESVKLPYFISESDKDQIFA